MDIRSIQGVDFTDARICLRVDFNIERTNIGNTEEHFRIAIIKDTLDYLAKFKGVKIALLTHLGRPEGKPNAEDSTENILAAVSQSLGRKVVFVPAITGSVVTEALATMASDEVLLLENVRFDPGEEANDIAFAAKLTEPFTHYINEAFSVCHRCHASMVAVTHLLPAYAGLHILRELRELDSVRFTPDRPAVALIGGAKIETKLPLIRAFEANYDCVLVGGKIANEAIDQKLVFSEKVLLPRDFNGEGRLDIGPNTIAYYSQILKMAKTIVWNGPMGKFEEKPYNLGTDILMHTILESKANVVVGGGESLSVLEQANALARVTFVSSGGGAMLAYLSGEALPGLLALRTS
ncbi:MAG: phosphoglycerate kinase [Patescibacteria group bacterium]